MSGCILIYSFLFQILHNIAVAEYFRDGCPDARKLLAILNKVKVSWTDSWLVFLCFKYLRERALWKNFRISSNAKFLVLSPGRYAILHIYFFILFYLMTSNCASFTLSVAALPTQLHLQYVENLSCFNHLYEVLLCQPFVLLLFTLLDIVLRDLCFMVVYGSFVSMFCMRILYFVKATITNHS